MGHPISVSLGVQNFTPPDFYVFATPYQTVRSIK